MSRLEFFKRRWLEFRWGYSYIQYALGGINFLTITYYLLIERVPALKSIFPHFYMYAITGVIVLPLVAVTVGHLHKKQQLRTDVAMSFEPLAEDIERRVRRVVREEMRR
jgi:hypothetical protein